MKFNLFICILFFSSFSYSSYQYETVLDELDDAWSFVFLSEDKILYTEMPGALKVASLDDKSIVEVKNVPEVQYVSQGGLSEVILDPNFIENKKIYLSYSAKNSNNKSTLFLMSAELIGNELKNNKVIFEANAPRRTAVHLGAKIAFKQDGTLLLASGDGYDHREKAQ